MIDRPSDTARLRAKAMSLALEQYALSMAYVLHHGDPAPDGVSRADHRAAAKDALSPFLGLLEFVEGPIVLDERRIAPGEFVTRYALTDADRERAERVARGEDPEGS